MKLVILLLSFLSLLSSATETQVISGQTKHIANSDGSVESFVSYLILNDCNIDVKATEVSDGNRISITFSDREIKAEGFSIKSNEDGSCTLVLVKGKNARQMQQGNQ